MTWSPEFAGGAEASQNGLGDLIPARSIDRSAIFPSQLSMNRHCGNSSIGNRVYNFLSAVDAITPGINFRVFGSAGLRIDDNAAARITCHFWELCRQFLGFRLADGDNDQIARFGLL